MRATRSDVVVIGAGLAGLSAAYELAEAGVNVTVVEVRTLRGVGQRHCAHQMRAFWDASPSL